MNQEKIDYFVIPLWRTQAETTPAGVALSE
jgi:hypothetical protein